MNVCIQKLIKILSQIINQQEKNQYIFPQELILIFTIQQQFVALSYIYGASEFSYLTVFIAFARPQIYIPSSILGSYLTLIIALIYILNFIPLLNLKYTGAIGQLLKCGMLNFFFEITSGPFQILPHILIILISLVNSIILEGTLNIKIVNFQKIQLSFQDAILVILNILIMILFKYTSSQIAIDITAFCIIFFQIINLIVGQPSISIKNKAIFLTINFFSLYFGIIKSFNLINNTQTEMIMIPLMYRISLYAYEQVFRTFKYKNIKGLPTSISQVVFFIKNIDNYSQLQVQTPESIEHQIIFSTIKMAKNLNYVAYKDLVSLKFNNNILLNLKINLILQQCLRKISYDTQNNSKPTNSITLISQQLIENENQNFETQINIIELLHDKIECMRLLIEENYILKFDHLLTYIEKLINLQNILVKQYETFPCERTQSVLGFFYTELLNDYLATNQLFSILAISDEKMKKIALNQDVFNSKMIYLITEFNGKMKIKFSSYDADSFLGISNESLTNKIIDDLIPPVINENHDEMVIDFLKNGKSKYLRQLQVNFLFYKYQQYMMEIDFAIETNLIQELNFIVFIQPTMSQVLSIILDLNFTIACMSKALIQELDLQESIKFYLGMNISKIIPTFPNIILENHFIENAEAHFENQDVRQSSTSRGHPYHTSYCIRTKKLDDRIAYYYVQFEYFKRTINNQVSSYSDSVNTTHHLVLDYIYEDNVNEICEEAPVEVPIEEDVKRQNPLQIYGEGLCSEQSHMINEFKFEQTNIKSTFRCNQTLLEQKFYSNVHKIPSKLSNQLISHKNDSYINDQQVKVDGCQSSQISSQQGLKRSEFYKKYELYSKIRLQVGNSKYHKLFIFTFTFSIISQVIIQSIQIAKLNINLQHLAADIDLLQIKNLVYQPFESFLLTRWTIFNYIQMQVTGEITQQEFNYLVEFPRQNLNLGYDQLDSNLKQILDRISVSGFFENKSLDIYIYVSTGEGELYNLTLRNSIQILLNYQYEIKKRYQIEGTIVQDSPYVYYSYKNYLTMKSEFNQLNEQILSNTIAKSQQEQSQEELIFIIAVGIALIQFCLSFNYFLQIQRLINKFYGFIQNMDTEYTYQEINRLKFISGRLNKNTNPLFRFQINIEQREKEFQYKTFIQNIKKKVLNRPYYLKQYFFYYLYIIFVLVLMIGNALLTYEECGEYLSKYPETAQFFKAISDVGTDIPTMYAQRDILYNIELIAPFLNDTEKARLLQEIKESLNRTTNFITLDFNMDNLIISTEFKDYYNQIQKENLCNFLPNYISSKSQSICHQIMDQNLERGLLGLLIYISNFINTDMAINHFTKKLQQSYLELEGAFLVSYIIKDINTSFHFDLKFQTQFYINKISVHNLVILIFLCILIVLTLTKIKNKLIYKLYLAQRLPYLMPIKTIILNDSFERNLRQIMHI